MALPQPNKSHCRIQVTLLETPEEISNRFGYFSLEVSLSPSTIVVTKTSTLSQTMIFFFTNPESCNINVQF